MSGKPIRILIDVPLKDHKRIKILAAAEGMTLSEFIIECIHERIYAEKLPNKKNRKAMEDVRKGKTVKAENFDDLCKQLGI